MGLYRDQWCIKTRQRKWGEKHVQNMKYGWGCEPLEVMLEQTAMYKWIHGASALGSSPGQDWRQHCSFGNSEQNWVKHKHLLFKNHFRKTWILSMAF